MNRRPRGGGRSDADADLDADGWAREVPVRWAARPRGGWPEGPDGAGGGVDGRTRVWTGRAGERVREADLAVLDEGERERLAGLLDPVDRARYAGARAAVRRATASELSADPDELVWGRWRCPGCGSGAHGPPRLVWPPSARGVSVSRSGDRWLLALCGDAPVGADIERRTGQALAGVLRSGLSAAERRYVLSRSTETDRRDALLRCWVRKEAVVKGWGVGLGVRLAGVDVRPHREAAVVRRERPGGRVELWEVREVPVGEECVAAVARLAGVAAGEGGWSGAGRSGAG